MKKLLVLAVALLISSAAWAATTTNFTATATFAGDATFSFQLKNISNDQNASNLTWAEADAFIMGGTTTWVKAQQYAVVAATITKANASVLMYTDNKTKYGDNLDPNFNEWVNGQGKPGTEAYGGLVRNVNGQLPSDFVGAYRGYIPVLFSMNTQKESTNNVITSTGSQIVVGGGTTGQPVTRADRFLSEKGNPSYSAGYATIASLNGPTFGYGDQGAWGGACTNNTAYMYFFGGFKDIIGGDNYSTTVYVEQSWD